MKDLEPVFHILIFEIQIRLNIFMIIKSKLAKVFSNRNERSCSMHKIEIENLDRLSLDIYLPYLSCTVTFL